MTFTERTSPKLSRRDWYAPKLVLRRANNAMEYDKNKLTSESYKKKMTSSWSKKKDILPPAESKNLMRS